MEIETKLKNNQRVFAVILVIIIVVTAYLFYQQEELHRQQQPLQNQINVLQQNFQQWQNNQLNNEISALNTARALIVQADVNLQSKQNPLLTLNLLKAAQQQITSFHNEKIATLQQTLQIDITFLQQIQKVDLATLARDINALNEKISTLKFLELEATPSTTTSDNKIKNSAWQSLRSALSSVVTIQHIDTSLTPILSNNQKIAVQQYLRELLQQSWWAAEQHDNALYQISLNNIVITLNQFVINGTKSFQPTLGHLQKIDVTQTWPTQLHSATALQQLMNGK